MRNNITMIRRKNRRNIVCNLITRLFRKVKKIEGGVLKLIPAIPAPKTFLKFASLTVPALPVKLSVPDSFRLHLMEFVNG